MTEIAADFTEFSSATSALQNNVALVYHSRSETRQEDKKFIKIWQPKAGLEQCIVQ